MIINNTSQIYVSIDIGCRQHSVAIGLPNGDVLDEFDILHRPEGFTPFFERIEHHHRCHGGTVVGPWKATMAMLAFWTSW
ncbi:hypothetical protein [Nitrosomonas sp. Nm34]|uniref:hypothetical protein n=1 Tax=Nitrosomonas sp. Nm34 TaxID=1881055 RepID=UPI0008F24C09|nr:hypothetical protein [Nitrosomonas sp. Nm34]SFI42294.1 hypothetical protein SAMN05428978_100970 [Nitrosomonas sp. Nm34]